MHSNSMFNIPDGISNAGSKPQSKEKASKGRGVRTGPQRTPTGLQKIQPLIDIAANKGTGTADQPLVDTAKKDKPMRIFGGQKGLEVRTRGGNGESGGASPGSTSTPSPTSYERENDKDNLNGNNTEDKNKTDPVPVPVPVKIDMAVEDALVHDVGVL